MLYSACTKPDTNYIIMTHHASVSKSLFVKLKKMYKNLPHDKYDIFPKALLNNRDELYLENGSRIIIATAQGEDAISGNSFQLIHLSEMAKYPADVQEEIIATCIPALAKNESSAIIIESTAFGYNTYQEMFMKAWRDKESVWKAHFYSWLAKAYEKQFKHTFDEAEAWFRANNNGRRMTYEDLEHDEKILRDKYGATYRQLMFRRYYIATNSLDKFKREFPTTPDEAFQTSNRSIFDTSKIIERLQYAIEPLETKEVYHELPDILKPYVNKNLFIYRLPKKGVRMFAGIDVASGVKSDYTTCVIIDAEGKQMASWYSNDISVSRCAEIFNELLRFYNYAYVSIERNGVGQNLIEIMRRELNYMNMYKEKLFNATGKRVYKLGLYISNTNKSRIVEDFKRAFEEGYVLVECKRTLDEMKIFVESDNKKIGNKKGNNFHDDMVMAFCHCIQAWKMNKYYVDI
ncbi:MAG: DNA packaging protein [Symbiobacterium thermophilum]|uniref:DNA packaging protein n=2 Tax=Symbiobacterium thermophilum TaxID=2734 RepID=A0A953I6W1_SYMTR|nr:DNA packaging protein [Symbiobacterium thermophilum]